MVDPESSAELQRKAKPEERVVFMAADSIRIGEDPQGNALEVPKFLVLGVSRDAYKFMSKGRTHTFDLRYLGLPTQLVMFGGKSRAHILDQCKIFSGDAPVVADMHSEHAVAEDESMIFKMRAAARAWQVFNGYGDPQTPLADCTDEELDRLFKAILRIDITQGDLRAI